jgi:excisionase family DNA binding protein
MLTESPWIYRREEAAKRLNVSLRKVDALLASGELKSFKASGKLRLIPATAIQEYIDRQLAESK